MLGFWLIFILWSTLTYTVPVHLRNKFTDPDADDP
jgi:hypothetical protein